MNIQSWVNGDLTFLSYELHAFIKTEHNCIYRSATENKS